MDQQNETNNQNSNPLPEKNIEAETKNSIFVRQIAKEVEREKKRLVINNFIISSVQIIGLIFLLIWSVVQTKSADFGVILFLLVFFNLLIFLMLVYSIMSWYKFNQEKKVHFVHVDQINSDRLPIFAIDAYKRNSFWKIVITWFSIFCYLVLISGLVVFHTVGLIQNQDDKFNFWIFEISMQEKWQDQKFVVQTIVFYLLIGAVFVVQIFTYIQTTKKAARLNALFDVDKKIDKDDLRKYKRNLNILCAIIFLSPLFILGLSWWLFKKIRKK